LPRGCLLREDWLVAPRRSRVRSGFLLAEDKLMLRSAANSIPHWSLLQSVVTMPQGAISYQVLKAGRSLVTPKPLQPIRGHWFTLDCVPNCSTSADITRFVPGKTMFPHSSPLIGLPFESASRMKYCRWSTFCSPGSPLNWVWR